MDEVLIPYGDSPKDTATLLLGAAEDAGYEPYVVRHQPDDAGFRVPEDVARKAGFAKEAKAAKADEEPVPAKKTAAKKAPAKKTASKE